MLHQNKQVNWRRLQHNMGNGRSKPRFLACLALLLMKFLLLSADLLSAKDTHPIPTVADQSEPRSRVLQRSPSPTRLPPEVQWTWLTDRPSRWRTPCVCRTHSWPCSVTSWVGHLQILMKAQIRLGSRLCSTCLPLGVFIWHYQQHCPFACSVRFVPVSQFLKLNKILLGIHT